MEKMMQDRVAIITGSGRGIGKCAALQFAAAGAKVVVSDIDAAPANETVAEIKQAGGEAVAYVGDVSGAGFADGIVKAAVDTWGGLHMIVNNAGYTWDSTIHKMTDEQWDAILDLHLKAPFRIIRAAAPYYRDAAKKEQEQGIIINRKIVNISSTSGINGNPGQANYSAAKAGVVGLTKTLAREWGQFNVQVNSVAYGWIDTRLTQSIQSKASIDIQGREIAVGIQESRRQAMMQMIPLRRPGTPDEAARVIFFFASPLSDYVSGQVLLVTGGN
jgi:3-oxoacyl-[acyl-carrier protein] reductase